MGKLGPATKHWSVSVSSGAALQPQRQSWAVVTETLWPPKLKIFTNQTFKEKVCQALVINNLADKELGLSPIEVLVVGPLFCLMSQFRNQTHRRYLWWFGPRKLELMRSLQCKTHTTVLCLMAGGAIQRAWGCLLALPPPFLPDWPTQRRRPPYFRAQLMCVSPQPCFPSPKSHLYILSKPHVSPELEARGERWSGRGIQETEQTEMKDAFKRVGQPQAGLIQLEGPSEMRAAITSSLPTRVQ